MANEVDMKLVRVGKGTFKVRPERLDAFMEAHPDGEVVGGGETKAAASKKASAKKDEKDA